MKAATATQHPRAAQITTRAGVAGAKAEADSLAKGFGADEARLTYWTAFGGYMERAVDMLVGEQVAATERNRPMPEPGHYLMGASAGGLPLFLEYSTADGQFCIEAIWSGRHSFRRDPAEVFSREQVAAWYAAIEQHHTDLLRVDPEPAPRDACPQATAAALVGYERRLDHVHGARVGL